jgi:hypothetical protein
MKFATPNIWAKKRFGIVSITDWTSYFQKLAKRLLRERDTLLAANAAEGFHPGGLSTYYPIDAPYTVRYLAVQFCPSNTALPAGLSVFSGFPLSSLCQLWAKGGLAIPLGICTDEPDNSTLDQTPFSANVTLLGSAQGRTQIGITDGVVNYNTLLVCSASQNGQLTALSATPGSYWSPGLALTTSEGAGAQIEFDPRIQVVNVDVIT